MFANEIKRLLMKHLPKDTEGVKLPGLQEIIHSFTTALSQKSISLSSYSTLFSHNK